MILVQKLTERVLIRTCLIIELLIAVLMRMIISTAAALQLNWYIIKKFKLLNSLSRHISVIAAAQKADKKSYEFKAAI